MTKCKNARRYKGYRKPTCNNGVACEACVLIWLGAQSFRQNVAK
jgi:hypothetical protein